MSSYFGSEFGGGKFIFYSTSHNLALLILLVFFVSIYLLRQKLKNEPVDKIVRYTLAATLILQEFALNVWHLAIGTWSVATSLPLHLCGVAIVLSAVGSDAHQPELQLV